MAHFLDFFAQQRVGILVTILVLFSGVLLLQWISWIFEWGRFKNPTKSGNHQDLRFVITDFFLKIIDDFRHLLALILVLVFLFALVLMLWPGC